MPFAASSRAIGRTPTQRMHDTERPDRSRGNFEPILNEREYFSIFVAHKGKKVLPRPLRVRVTGDPEGLVGKKFYTWVVVVATVKNLAWRQWLCATKGDSFGL